jgi:hypothetical protein
MFENFQNDVKSKLALPSYIDYVETMLCNYIFSAKESVATLMTFLIGKKSPRRRYTLEPGVQHQRPEKHRRCLTLFFSLITI